MSITMSIPTACEQPKAGTQRFDVRETLRAFLATYWLRPENAVWMTLRSSALQQAGFASFDADICCGDGIFSFLHAGGGFDGAFDVFSAVDRLERVTNQHADMFDCAAREYAPQITRPPAQPIGLGADLKPNLLAKARTLGLYERLIQQDANQTLCVADDSLAAVYCNSAYWVAAIDAFLRELRRVTRPDGRIVLHVKLSAMRAYTLDGFRAALGERFLEIIGRGRLECWPTVGTRREWEVRFKSAGLGIVAATPLATRTHAQIWDVGLRPLAPLLVRMANGLTPEARGAIKRDWIELLSELALPLCSADLHLLSDAGEPAEMQYVLERA